MRPFLTNSTKRIVSASASVVASLASVCSVSLLSGSAVTLTTLLSAQSASAAFNKTAPIAVQGEIVMWVPAGISSARVTEIADAANCVVVHNIGANSRYYLLRLKSVGTTRAIADNTATSNRAYKIEAPSAEVLAAIDAIKAKQPDALADPNYVRRPSRVQAPVQQGFIPNDTFYSEHWDKRMINMPVAWAFQNGSRPVVVADIDTGFDVGHPDFFRAGTPIYIDPINTAITDINGNPTTTNVNSPDGHGVHTAGTIAAVTNNNEGVSGVAGYNGFGVNVRLLPIRASFTVLVDGPDQDDDPDHNEELFFDSAILLGILKSVEAGAVAINMSLGGFGSSTTQSLAISDAIKSGTVIVAATGNDTLSADVLPAFPANYPGVIAVSAVNHLRQLASYSNYGGNTTITAPGGDFIGGFGLIGSIANAAETRILSTFPRDVTGIISVQDQSVLSKATGYAYSQGTSMACPQVTGAVALLAAAGATAAEIPGILTETATPLPDTSQVNLSTGVPISSRSAYGAGLLNVAKALQPRIRILGGEQFGDSDFLGSSASDIGTTYFRKQTYDVSIAGVGNLIREIGNGSSLTYRLEEATRPTSPVQEVVVSPTSLPAPGTGESPFVTRAFPLPVTPVRLGQNRYKASLTLNYRGIISTQIQFFEVLEYNQPIGLTLFSVPFTPARTGVTPEQQVLTVGSGFAISRYDPLNPLGPQNDGYARYQPGDGGRTDVYARFDNTTHSKDLRTELTKNLNNPGVPLSYAIGNPAVSLAPIGVGYWVNMSETRPLETEGTPATSPVAIPLYGVENQFNELTEVGGWNLIGAPFPYPVNWSAVTVRQQTPVGVRDYSLQEAIAADIINAQLVGWDVTTRSYYYSVAPGGQLLPFRAYWVRALKDCTLIVPPNRSKQSLISRAANTKAGSNVPQGDGWRVRLSASVAGDRDAENYIGQVQGATEGEDRYDVPKPPTGPSHAYVRFLNTDRRGRKAAFAYDMRPAATGRQKAEWTMAVGAGKGDTDVTLTWDGLRNLPSRSKLVLKDTVTGKIISMNGRSSYTYKNTEAGATRMFTVSLGTQNTAGPLQIRNIRTVAASGGRAEQRGLNVRFALSQDADVQARIKTLSGKVVDVLSGATRGVGQQEMVLRWRGRTSEGSEVPSGPYVLEITARTDEGETVTVKRPITYLQ